VDATFSIDLKRLQNIFTNYDKLVVIFWSVAYFTFIIDLM